MGRPPLPLQVDTMPSAYVEWSHSQWLLESMELGFCHEAAGPLAHPVTTYIITALACHIEC